MSTPIGQAFLTGLCVSACLLSLCCVASQVVFTRGGQGEAVNKQRIAKVKGAHNIRNTYIIYMDRCT